MKNKLLIGAGAFLVLILGYSLLTSLDQTKNAPKNENVNTNIILDENKKANLIDIMTIDDEGNTSVKPIALENVLSNAHESPLTKDEIAGVFYMLEEEKLAYDVYRTLYDMWGKRTFDNISQAEQTHVNALYSLADTYLLNVDFVDSEIGVFTNEKLSKIYTDLTAQGRESLDAALRVGALIEELDIMDLQKYIDDTENLNLITVYDNLQKGSRNHLRAFVKNISGDYEPIYLSEADYLAIILSDTERGGGGGNGHRRP